jgi:hypothetical protein
MLIASDKRHVPVTKASFLLWQLRSPRGIITECALQELENSGRFQVTHHEDSHLQMWMTFDSPVIALEWALNEDDRLITEGWRTPGDDPLPMTRTQTATA